MAIPLNVFPFLHNGTSTGTATPLKRLVVVTAKTECNRYTDISGYAKYEEG